MFEESFCFIFGDTLISYDIQYEVMLGNILLNFGHPIK